MKLLLDTHVWIWVLTEPQLLAHSVVEQLQKRNTELWLSPMSTWEFTVLIRKKRLTVSGDPLVWVREAFLRLPVREAAITHEVALATHHLKLPHHDPADRILAATAMVYGLTLVTADQQLLSCRQIPTLSCR